MKISGNVSLSFVLFGAVALGSYACGGGSGFSGSSGNTQSEPKPDIKNKSPSANAKSQEKEKDPDTDSDDKGQTDQDDSDAKDDEGSIAPEEAVVKGSFSAWTEPKNPAPRRPYVIIIEVRLPSENDSFSKQNLSGSVRGTDGYFRQLGAQDSSDLHPGNPFKSQFSRAGKMVYLRVPIPGAERLVKDTIFVTADTLGESQELVLQFGGK